MRTAAILASALALAAPALTQDTIHEVLNDGNWADPAIIKVDDVVYLYATEADGPNVKMATSHDIGQTFSSVKQPNGDRKDPLPNVGKWCKPGNGDITEVWAPDVIQLPDGTFVMYYSALNNNAPGHCVGAATSKDPEGPFEPLDNPLRCHSDQGGAIDANGFIDDDGTIYVAYKVDGSGVGKSTPIMLQKMKSDGVTLDGDSTQMITNDKGDGPLVEAPSLIKVDGTYFLGFSSNMFNTDLYDTSYATATDITGPWTKASSPNAPLLTTGMQGLVGPGGADFLDVGGMTAFHGWNNKNPKAAGALRQIYICNVKFDAKAKTISVE
ncbi:hypothetical protein KEM55_002543 [Ascosphaera atra]|nr:hypothetical protein KEM55_002543 [Ascosphaera atra]